MTKSKIGRCSYHLCRKKSELFQCNYCHDYFCKEHANPKPAGLPNFTGTKTTDELYMEEWHKSGGHPCFPFTKIWTEKVKKEKEEETQKFLAALDSMKKKERESPKYITAIPMRSSKKIIQKKGIDEDYEEEPKNSFTKKKNKKENDILGWILLIIILGLVIGGIFYFKHWQAEAERIAKLPHCNDGTLYNTCSKSKPLYCYEGNLVDKAATCGCPDDSVINFQSCKEIPKCSDRTLYDACSKNKPFYCQNGTLISKASLCGCDYEETRDGEKCLTKYQTNPKTIHLGSFDYVVYGGVNDYLAGLPRAITYTYTAPTTKDFILRDLDNEVQKENLIPFVEKIREKESTRKAQANLAISIVQGIPYDWEAFNTNSVDGRYPYEVLYDMKGVCMEKADLLAFTLRELGFGVAIFEFTAENHRAVGIKCSHGNYNTNYCFIESTDYYPMGQIPYEYVGGVDIRNAIPEVVIISQGDSYD